MPFLILLLALTSLLSARQAPYGDAPPADPPYFRVRYDAQEVSDLIFPVQYTVWIPRDVKTLRGVIVHQHGCGVGSCTSGLTGAFDLHWQALDQKHHCALLAPVYEQPETADCQRWCDPRNGSDAAFRQSLADLGQLSGHPELASVPWALWGHSGGGHWAGGMLLLHPDRVAAAWLRSGVPLLSPHPDRSTIKPHPLPDAALAIPIMCNFGTKEGFSVGEGRFAGVWPANEAFFDTLRARSRTAPIGLAIDPLTAHECGNQRYLAIPWFDACLGARLPDKPGAPLRPLAGETSGTFVTFHEKRLWLPGKETAALWSAYVKDTLVPDPTPPPAPTHLKVDGPSLTWQATADLESGLAHFIIERDGKEIATVPEKPANKFGRPLFQGLQYSDTPAQALVAMTFTDPHPTDGKSTYRVIAVNTAGLRSH